MNLHVRLTVGDLISALRRAALRKADERAERLAEEAARAARDEDERR